MRRHCVRQWRLKGAPSHSQALKLLAKSHGDHALHDAIGNGQIPQVPLGQVVTDACLKQRFLGEVIGVTQLSEGRCEVSLLFDQPLDVVILVSFSNIQSRVTKVIGPDGRSIFVTSDRVYNMVLHF